MRPVHPCRLAGGHSRHERTLSEGKSRQFAAQIALVKEKEMPEKKRQKGPCRPAAWGPTRLGERKRAKKVARPRVWGVSDNSRWPQRNYPGEEEGLTRCWEKKKGEQGKVVG